MPSSIPASLLRGLSRDHILRELDRRRIDAERRDVSRRADQIRAECRTLIGFVRAAWHVLEPNTPFVEGWATRAICAHLEAITFGTFLALGHPNKVRFNVPPGTTKSRLISVMWNAWEWGPAGMPWLRHLSTSYVKDYVERDVDFTQKLIRSDWYQSLWGVRAVGFDAHGDCAGRVVLTKSSSDGFENTRSGSRKGVPFNRLTGGRGDRLTIDDPLSVAQAKSDADREHAQFIMREAVPTRINNPVKSAIVLIMQRLHKDDPSGMWEQLEVPHIAVILPMRFEADTPCRTPIFADPREVEGELLFPERFPLKTVDALEREMSAYAVAGQHQQRPVPREGGMFKRHWFEYRANLPPGYRWCRHWDLADTEATYGADPPYTAGVLIGTPMMGGDGPYVVGDCVRLRAEAPEVSRTILTTAEKDRIRINAVGGTYEVQVPQDPGSAGKVVARQMVKLISDAGYNAHKLIETGSKIDRAEPLATKAENGEIVLVEGVWNEPFLDEVCLFPGTKFKDQTDAMSAGFVRLTKSPRRGKPRSSGKPLAIFGR